MQHNIQDFLCMTINQLMTSFADLANLAFVLPHLLPTVDRTRGVFQAVLAGECEENFAWLFQNYAKAVGNKHPETCFTDRDAAAMAAMGLAWSGTANFNCIWHLLKNIRENLQGVLGDGYPVSGCAQLTLPYK